ncbi:MATE family efflux transporter [Parablautia sp. Marseille-Q6255]|uniref:MATE family efflux transporter n=1 Tax=Parablautia sp. Marseille-Q6255 TaxID=3039593 RepID=UPI0024BD5467|nr:MATE family efflux transporter [Parablautia sp. Marseille-Q6255]
MEKTVTNNSAAPTQNKMGTMPIPKLLLSMSLPMVIAMLVQAMYNIVDSIFVSQINENALTAVSLAFPIQNLMIAVATGIGVGVNALLSRSLGEKNYEQAEKAANVSVLLSVLSYIVFALIGLFGSRLFFASQTQDPQILEYGIQYMSIICIFSFGIFIEINMERLLQSTGRTFYTMITQGFGAIINIIFDPILIFGYFGFPKMGVAGAAAATVFGQIIAMALGIFFNLRKNKELKLSFKRMRFHGPTVKNIYAVGVPSILMASIGSVMTFGMNKILLQFSSTAATVLGVYFKLQSFFFMPLFGMNNGIVPIIAFNYGAQQKKRITQTIKIGNIVAFIVMVLGIIAFNLFPEMLLGFFNPSDDLLAIGCKALRTISISFLFAGFCIVFSSVFQALGNGMYSLFVSVSRQLLVLLPCAYLLAMVSGLDAVWWSFPIAEVVSVTVSVLLYRRIYKKKIDVIPE